MTRLQVLPASLCHEERTWYRGLTVLEQNVLPVVSPEGFLTSEELTFLDATTGAQFNTDANIDSEMRVAP
jgi:hypothetical protein